MTLLLILLSVACAGAQTSMEMVQFGLSGFVSTDGVIIEDSDHVYMGTSNGMYSFDENCRLNNFIQTSGAVTGVAQIGDINNNQKEDIVISVNDNNFPNVICYDPAFIARQRHNKTTLDLWGKTWETVQKILEGKHKEKKLPKVDCLVDPDKIIRRIKAIELPAAFDYETSGLRPELQDDFRIYCVGVADAKGTFAFPFDTPEKRLGTRDRVLTCWKAFLREHVRWKIIPRILQ